MGELRIISASGEPFQGRRQAGRLLAHELKDLRGRNPVVLGIPRGGVLVARELAVMLDGELDVVLTRKLAAPGNPELAIGAVAEDGTALVDEPLARACGVTEEYLREEKRHVLAEIARRAAYIRDIRPKVPLAGRVVVVTDDGVATGATMLAALQAARQEGPKELIAAVPVGAPDSIERLTEHADLVVCLRAPPTFHAVGQFFVEFEQVEDRELYEVLLEFAPREART